LEISPAHCALAQLPEICDFSGRLENPELVVLDAGLVLVVEVGDGVALCDAVFGILGKVERSKVAVLKDGATLCEGFVNTLTDDKVESWEPELLGLLAVVETALGDGGAA